jgi:hypothetical protein
MEAGHSASRVAFAGVKGEWRRRYDAVGAGGVAQVEQSERFIGASEDWDVVFVVSDVVAALPPDISDV